MNWYKYHSDNLCSAFFFFVQSISHCWFDHYAVRHTRPKAVRTVMNKCRIEWLWQRVTLDRWVITIGHCLNDQSVEWISIFITMQWCFIFPREKYVLFYDLFCDLFNSLDSKIYLGIQKWRKLEVSYLISNSYITGLLFTNKPSLLIIIFLP